MKYLSSLDKTISKKWAFLYGNSNSNTIAPSGMVRATHVALTSAKVPTKKVKKIKKGSTQSGSTTLY